MRDKYSDDLLRDQNTRKNTEYPAYSEEYLLHHKREAKITRVQQAKVDCLVSHVPDNMQEIIRQLVIEDFETFGNIVQDDEAIAWILIDNIGFSVSFVARHLETSRRSVYRILESARHKVYTLVDTSWFGSYIDSCRGVDVHYATYGTPVPDPLAAAREWIEEQGYLTMMLPENHGQVTASHPDLKDPMTGKPLEMLLTARKVISMAINGNSVIRKCDDDCYLRRMQGS